MNDTIASIAAVLGMAVAFRWMCCTPRPKKQVWAFGMWVTPEYFLPKVRREWIPPTTLDPMMPTRHGTLTFWGPDGKPTAGPVQVVSFGNRGGKTARLKQQIDEILKERGS